jgi:hypothetical protein
VGEQLRHEFSMGGIDTGKTSPPVQVPVSLTGDAGTTQIPGLPIHRPSFLTAFLANLGPSLGFSLAASGPQGEQNFGTAFAGGMAGIQSYQEKMAQRAMQMQEMQQRNIQLQRQAAQEASTQRYQEAETNRLNTLTPLEAAQGQLGLQEKQLQTDLLRGQIKFFADPGNLTAAVQDATKNLGKLSPDEQSQVDAAVKQAAIDRKFDPVAAAVKSLSQDRITQSRQEDTTAFKTWHSQFVKEHGREPSSKEVTDFSTAGQALRLVGMGNTRDVARSDKSYQFTSTQLDKVGAPIEQAVQRFGRLQDTINQRTPQADALVAPELLTVMAGGQGSGLRMNEAEIARVVGGRSNLEGLKAALNKWQLDPSKALSITDAQRQQIRGLMNEVQGKLLRKQNILDQARQDLINADNPTEHRKVLAGARQQLTAIDEGKAAQPNQVKEYDWVPGKGLVPR